MRYFVRGLFVGATSVVLVVLCQSSLAKTIYRGVDDSGAVMFSDRPIVGVKQQAVTANNKPLPKTETKTAAQISPPKPTPVVNVEAKQPLARQQQIQQHAEQQTKAIAKPRSKPEKDRSFSTWVWDKILDVK